MEEKDIFILVSGIICIIIILFRWFNKDNNNNHYELY